MKRISVLATALAVAGSALLMPVTASADPVITITSEGIPVEPGVVGGWEQPLHIDITGCVTESGDPAYIGYFLSFDGVPSEQFEQLTGPGGALVAEPVVGLQPSEVVVDLNWYCSDAPVNDSPEAEPYSILYLSPNYVYTIAAAPEAFARSASMVTTSTARTTAAKTTATKKATAKKATAKKPVRTKATTTKGLVKQLSGKKAAVATNVSGDVSMSGAVEVTTDPNALPAIDKMGIHGAEAAALKAKVDKRAYDNNAVARLLAAMNRKPAPTPTNAQYVTAAYQVLAGKAPAAPVMAPYVSQLNADGFRVSVVESIALTKHDADYYNS